jgi:HEAT repeat protein
MLRKLASFAILSCTALYWMQGNTPSRQYRLERGRAYSLLISTPAAVETQVTLTDPSGATLTKPLHAGDADMFLTLKPRASGPARVEFHPPVANVDVTLTPLPAAENKDAQIAGSLHNTWETAETIQLGRPVYASGDDRPYIPRLSSPKETFDQMMAGVHWYKLDYAGPGDRLVHFNLEVLDRDVPADLAVFTIGGGTPVEYTRGRERYETEKSTNFHGLHKFAPRILSPGVYYLRVMANHPYYKLESDVYPAPPYTDPRQAVRTAMDYIVRKGDSWHANVPRKGAVALRTSNPLQETRLCIACHPTHFSTRSELIAADNGYPVRARASLQFLIERLYNNPRPVYGKTDASWARMIHAPGNVLSRLAYLTDKFDRNFTPGERREELYRGIAAYLEMYWPGVTEPSNESNGNLPRISGYEVAMHNAMLFADLHRRTNEGKYAALRDQIEQLIANGKTADMLDLCWKLDALVWLGRDKYKAQITALVDQIFSHQKPDGSWAMPFGMEEIQYDFTRQQVTVKKLPKLPGADGPRSSEFQTWHAIYALARAGVTIDDARLKKAVDLCLSRQQPFGGWQGNPDYKNFDTPFRDTQYAIMALSTLFPAAKQPARGWHAGFPAPPKSWDDSNPAGALAAIEQHWEPADASTTARLRKSLRSPHVLVRARAAAALGRMADAQSLEALVAKLGDPSKIVQRSTAWAVRQIASRRPSQRQAALTLLNAALDSTAERTRAGAVRVFNQHFKYLSEEPALLERLRRIASQDSAPAVKMAAIQALYQWWYWDRDLNHKQAIEDTLIAGLGREEHPWVRRNFIEAYYLTLDDNTRYLYGSWIPRVKRAEDKQAIEQGHKASVKRQAERFLAAMRDGNTLQRDGLLRALFTHHIRQGLPDVSALAKAEPPPTVQGHWVNGYRFAAMYDPLTAGAPGFTSIGNDSEPPQFYADSAPLVNEALRIALDDPKLSMPAMHALQFLRNLPLERSLAARILDLVKGNPAAAAIAKAQLKAALLDPAHLDRIAREGDAVALEVLAAINAKVSVSDRLAKTAPEDRAFPHLVALAAASDAPSVQRGFYSKRPQPQQAALRFFLNHKLPLPADYPEAQGPFAVGGALSVLAARDYTSPEVRRIVLAGLDHDIHSIRAQALTTLRSIESLHKDSEILQRVTRLKGDKEESVRRSALSFESYTLVRAGAGRGIRPADLLDYFYFKQHVEPLLVTKASDGQACANCHANHTLMKLNEADEYGTVTHQRSTENYRSVLGMVNVEDPEASLLLNKPISPLDSAGIGDSQTFSHGGGLRWEGGRNSAEYRTVLRWIRGARLDNVSTVSQATAPGAKP